MRNLKRNQQTVYYKNYEDSEDKYDEYGNLTGSVNKVYGDLKSCKISVSGSRGNTDNKMFGVNLDYDRTMSTADMSCDIDEFSILWIDRTDTDKPHDYKVVKRSVTLNQIVFAIKQVNVSE